MNSRHLVKRATALVVLVAVVVTPAIADTRPSPTAQDMAANTSNAPRVGDTAADFTLTTLTGGTVRLSQFVKEGPVVLVVLRGWPGYDCPFCTRQFADYLAGADAVNKAGLRVLFIYPGPADRLDEHARAFTSARRLPDHFVFALDPDYTFTTRYHLRWDAPNETAYPATFIIDSQRRVLFARISREHGGRTPVSEVLAAAKRGRPGR